MEFFAGKMDFNKLDFLPRLIVKAMKTPQGDSRNWDAIGVWSDLLYGEIVTTT